MGISRLLFIVQPVIVLLIVILLAGCGGGGGGSDNTSPPVSTSGVVTTLAGLEGSEGSADGMGSAARFNTLRSIAVDNAGNVYVADTENFTIRKLTPAGVVTTIAGLAGSAGSADGTGSAARFNFPFGVAVDSFGNVYVADTVNFTIRKITPAGVVTTFAGLAGSGGEVDGTGATARFLSPKQLAIDTSNNIYVSDRDGNTIRKITPAGTVTTLAGFAGSSGDIDGTGANARFNNPEHLAVDRSGNVYVVDEPHIRKITPAGVVTTLTFTSESEPAFDDFNIPLGLAVDSSGNLYLANDFHILKITPAGLVKKLAGSTPGGAGGDLDDAQFMLPEGLALDSSGNIYVADDDTIRKITLY
jgi:sugar lactone lactonase YvrE